MPSSDSKIPACVKGRRHCWHQDGTVVLASMPKQHEVCCYCGTRVERHLRLTMSSNPAHHGPYHPERKKS